MGKRKTQSTGSHEKAKRSRQNNNDSEEEDDTPTGRPNALNSARCGKILTVKLRNFMCHSNLVVDFNERTNLLIGQNGSGKSAILTALIIGLGSKANATNRSSSIKDLIKTGESSSTIEVHISNDGCDSYEHEKYGNRIVVVRQIAASGSSTYKLKSATGNVDNPVCVMTQDASRSFLRDSNPKKRYELFLKATQMDVIIEKLNGCIQQIEVSRAKYKSQQKQQHNLLEIQKKAHEKLNQFKSMEPLKASHADQYRFKSERAWLSVVQQEEFMRAVNSEIETTQRKRDQCDEKLASYNVNDQELNEKNAKLDEEIQELQTEQINEQTNLDEQKKEYRRVQQEASDNDREVKKYEVKMAKVQKTISTLEENIQKELDTNKNHIDELRQENEAKLADFTEKQKECESALKSHRRELKIYSNTLTKYNQQLGASKSVRSKLYEEKKKLENSLQLLNATPKEHLRSFGENMMRMVDELEQQFKRGKFEKMPIGPIANHVEVKSAKYRHLVEDALRGVLMAFCVDNANDLKTFHEIEKRFQFPVSTTVICSRFSDRQYDVSGKCVQSDSQTVSLMDLIVTDSPVVMNCLIDHCNIETVLFTKSFEHATHITSKKENVPRNLNKVILLEPYSEFFPAPAYRSYAKTSGRSRLLRVSVADREKAHRADLSDISEKIKIQEGEIKQIENKINENNKLADGHRNTISNLEASLRLLRLQITEIQSIEYPQEADVEIMQNEVTEQTKILAKINSEFVIEKGKIDRLNFSIQEIKTNINAIRSRLQTIENDIQMKQKSKDDINESVTKRDSMIAYYQKNKKTLTEAVMKYEKELDKIREKLNKYEATALKTGPRIDPTHTEEELNKLIKRNEVKLNAVNTSNESLEDVTQQAEKADADVQNNQDLLTVFGVALKKMKDSLRMRMANISRLKQFMITKTSHFFTQIMNLREIDGTLNYDSEAGTLDIQVIPRDKECANVVSKTTNLSGGERSYTTLAFLISLWTCVDHPFYFLDEYDVFTDTVNRMFMTKLLLNEAKKKTLQYTFLTPQDTSEIKQSKDLSILRLENPDR